MMSNFLINSGVHVHVHVYREFVHSTMDYRARRSWIGNAHGRLSKAGYGGSDVTFNNFIFINSILVVRSGSSRFIAVSGS